MNPITINDRDYTLNFGFAFLRELDKRYTVEEQGVKLGFGVQQAIIYLQQKDPLVLLDLIQAATATESQKPSVEGIEAYVVRQAENDRLDEVFADFLSALRTQPLTKSKARTILDAIED